jgi:hypothetical protein
MDTLATNALNALAPLDHIFSNCQYSYKGEVRIWVDYYFYASTRSAPTDGWLRGDCHQILHFNNYDEAVQFINELEGGDYKPRSGERSRPTYVISEA